MYYSNSAIYFQTQFIETLSTFLDLDTNAQNEILDTIDKYGVLSFLDNPYRCNLPDYICDKIYALNLVLKFTLDGGDCFGD